MDRPYCTIAELVEALRMPGVRSEAQAMRTIRSASSQIEREIGQFIPTTATRYYDGTHPTVLAIDPLLAETSIADDGDALETTDYVLYPRARHWENGPYTRVEIDPDSSERWTQEADVIAIAGRWGKYEDTVATGTTLGAALTDSATTMQVADGSQVSPGAVLLIGSEQIVVEATGAVTAGATTLAEDVAQTEEYIDVASASGLHVGEVILVGAEQMHILAIASNTLVVERAYNGTARVAHLTAASVGVYRTYTVSRGANGTTAAAHDNATAISRYVPPFEINWLAISMAALSLKQGETGFSAKSASPETGETYYHSFPKSDFERLQRLFRIVTL
jgi:hypothetical protein